MTKKTLTTLLFCTIFLLAFFLRFYKLGILLPPYWEEVALGYDAYAISQTGRDHHGNFLPIVAFESFGDWKPSLYFYSIVPFIKLVGLNVWAVRLPSFVAGLTIVVGIFILLKQIFSDHKDNSFKFIPFIGMAIAAISPWAIQFSRAGWEVNLATALVLWGVISFFYFLKEEKLWALLASVSLLCLSMYTYHATRIIAPILGLGLVGLWIGQSKSILKRIKTDYFKVGAALALAIAISAPLLLNLTNATTTQRFAETSIFSDISVIERSNALQQSQPGIIGKIFYHRYVLFGEKIFSNFLSHFGLNFLFINGDANPRHSIQYMGQLYHVEFFFLILGFYFVFQSVLGKKKNLKLIFLLFWLTLGIIPASLTNATPHALRILPTMPVFLILISVGIVTFTKLVTNNFKYLRPNLILFLICLAYIIELGMFWRVYTTVYPKIYSEEWQSGYEELMTNVIKLEPNYELVYITRQQGRPAMYYWFYNQISPKLVQFRENVTKQDQGEFIEFGKIKFVGSLHEVDTNLPNNSMHLVAGSPTELESLITNSNLSIKILKNISAANEKVIWQIGEISHE